MHTDVRQVPRAGRLQHRRLLALATAGSALWRLRAVTTRAVAAARTESDPAVLEDVGLPTARTRTVDAGKGVSLHVAEYGDPAAEVTVVLAHGWTLSSELWRRQVRDLADSARVVVYDHRGHGRSGSGSLDACTLEQLGTDLGAVLDAAVPTGPLLLVGHSMGGMAVMHLAACRPELFRDRVRGVALVSTSVGELRDLDLGLPRPLSTALRLVGGRAVAGLGRVERLAERTAGLPAPMWLALRHLNFGPDAPARLVDEMARTVQGTSVGTICAFYAGLLAHDGTPGLAALRSVPTVVLVGEHDRLTPVSHARSLAAALPDSRLVVVPGAGHMLIQERPEAVSRELRTLFPPTGTDGAPRHRAARKATRHRVATTGRDPGHIVL